MRTYVIHVRTLSPTLLGSGEGQGSVIDRDIVFDQYGLPCFPARRFKGLMRESCQEVMDMLVSGRPGAAAELPAIDDVFGRPGQSEPSVIQWSDLSVAEEAILTTWLEWLRTQNNGALRPLLEPQAVLAALTEERCQTRIGSDGIAAPGSLRSSRLLRKGIDLEGSIKVSQDIPGLTTLLALGAINLRHAGTGRNRGAGLLEVRLSSQEGENLTDPAMQWLEGGTR